MTVKGAFMERCFFCGLLITEVACGAVPDPRTSRTSALTNCNGLNGNGLNGNGLNGNGLNGNGLNGNGLNGNGLNGNGLNGNGLNGNGLAANRLPSGISSADLTTNPLIYYAYSTAGLSGIRAEVASGGFSQAWFADQSTITYQTANGPMVLQKGEWRRELFRYLVSTALPSPGDDPARSTIEFDLCASSLGCTPSSSDFIEHVVWTGQDGMAPYWFDHDLASAPSGDLRVGPQIVTAVIGARINPHGEHVMVSLRADPTLFPQLAVTDEERQAFTNREATYYGDIFQLDPKIYVVTGDKNPYGAIGSRKCGAEPSYCTHLVYRGADNGDQCMDGPVSPSASTPSVSACDQVGYGYGYNPPPIYHAQLPALSSGDYIFPYFPRAADVLNDVDGPVNDYRFHAVTVYLACGRPGIICCPGSMPCGPDATCGDDRLCHAPVVCGTIGDPCCETSPACYAGSCNDGTCVPGY